VADLLHGWAERGGGSLVHRLALALRSAIGNGLLAPGTQLPSERSLAQSLAVSRATVTAALDDLRADGTLTSRQGSGTAVAGPDRPSVTGTRVAAHFAAVHEGIDLATGNPPDASHLPPLQLDVHDLVTDGEGPGTQPLGLPALRRALAERHTQQGLVTQAEQIHVSAGAHQATGLALRCLAGRGAAIAVEDTSYPGIFDITDAMGATVVPLQRDRAGVLPESLDAAFTTGGVRAVYLQTGPHNPTGRVTPAGRLRALAEVLDHHRGTVVDDIALDDLAFDRRPRPRLASLCRTATVVTISSVSKVAWGGLRVGWMRGPGPLIEQTMHLRLGFDLGAAAPSQLIVLQLLPHLDDLAEQRRATLRSLVDRALEQLAREFPEWEVDPPQGGSVLWARTPLDDSGPLAQLAARHGVRVAPGSIASARRGPDPHVRICVDRPWPLVEEGLRRLRVAWEDLRAGAGADPVLG
jgi:DNA-binding transcriptional MocR family regulator